jgi:hypothetical protein
MKYIRPYNESFKKDEYYQKINRQEYNRALLGEDEESENWQDKPFSDDEVKKIKEWTKKYTIDFVLRKDKKTLIVKIKGIETNFWTKKDEYIDVTIHISTIGDEWYYIGITSSGDSGRYDTYRCDQFEGFIELMQDVSKEYRFIEINHDKEMVK